MEQLPSSLAPLSDRDIVAAVARLARGERAATANLVAALAELDARRLYLGEGFPSLFVYCTDHLHFSRHEAYHRIEAARAAREYPIVLEWLHDASLSLSAVSLLRPHLTADNHRALLGAARHQPTRVVEELVARVSPRPDTRTLVRRLPSAGVAGGSVAGAASSGREALEASRPQAPAPGASANESQARSHLAGSEVPACATADAANNRDDPQRTGGCSTGAWAAAEDGVASRALLAHPGLAAEQLVTGEPSLAHAAPVCGAPLVVDARVVANPPPLADARLGADAGLTADARLVEHCAATADPLPPPRAAVIRPLAPARYLLQMTISAETHEKLRRAQDLLRHAVPSADAAVVVDRALTVLLQHLKRTRCAARTRSSERAECGAARRNGQVNGTARLALAGKAASRPATGEEMRPAAGGARRERAAASAGNDGRSRNERNGVRWGKSPVGGSARDDTTRIAERRRVGPTRYIPAAVKRAVWARDGGQCAYVGAAGRCPERAFLEFHHKEPFARGGEATADNLELRCRAHNRHEADRAFGTAFMAERVSESREGASARKRAKAADPSCAAVQTRCAPSLYPCEPSP